MSWPDDALWLSFLVNLSLKAGVVVLVAYALSLALRRTSAATRHLLWIASAAALLLLPPLSAVLPQWKVPLWNLLPVTTAADYQVRAKGVEEHTPPLPGSTPPNRRSLPERSLAATVRLGWPNWALTVWAAGALAGIARLLLGEATVCWLIRRAKPVPGPLREITQTIRLNRPVRVLQSHGTAMPMTWGLLRPVILLPKQSADWPDERRRIVLLHELAHVRRQDCLTQLPARLACIIYWFHPLVWLAAREFLKERERAADDLVLNLGARPTDYAGHLLEVARSFQAAPATAWATVAMARRSQLEGRLRAILDSDRRRGAVTRSGVMATAVAGVCLVFPLAAMRPAQQAGPPLEERPPAELDSLAQRYSIQGDFEQLDRLADLQTKRGKYAEAEKLYRRWLELREEKLGPMAPELAGGLVKLAGLYRAWGKYSQAEPLYQRALVIQQATLGPDHPEVANTLYYLAVEAHVRRQFAQAEDYYQRALAIRTQTLGANSPELARLLTALGLLDEMQERTAEAEQLYRRAAAIAAPDSPDLPTTLSLYARLLRSTERSSEAALMDERADQLRRKHLQETYANDESPRPADEVHRIGGDIEAPRLLSKVEPKYSELARIAKYEGTVVLSVEVGVDGRAHNLQFKRTLGLGLDEQAAEAVRQWIFKPGVKGGQPVTVAATIEVNFRVL